MRWVVGAVVGIALGVGVALLIDRAGDGSPVQAPPARSLLRPDSLLTFVRQADLDGDGVQEVVLASRSKLFTHFELPTQYLDVYAYRDGSWRRVFDATRDEPAGDGRPEGMLDTPAIDRINRLVDSLQVVDLDEDGAAEVVAGILTVGAGPGPLELWVLSMEEEEDGFRTDFYAVTTRGGEIAIEGDRVVFEFPVYRPDDPGCCPSRMERQVIGFDEGSGSVEVLDRERTRVPQP
jgi:hypothetical protein